MLTHLLASVSEDLQRSPLASPGLSVCWASKPTPLEPLGCVVWRDELTEQFFTALRKCEETSIFADHWKHEVDGSWKGEGSQGGAVGDGAG